eukprot:Opistho-2@72586
MGQYISSQLSNAAKAVPEKMVERQRETQLQLREVQMAVAQAQARDTVLWLSAFTATVGILGTAAFIKTRRPTGFIPLLPLSFVTAYNYDFAYGNKIDRIREEAGRILLLERDPSTVRFLPPLHNLLIGEDDYRRIFSTNTPSSTGDSFSPR